MLEIIDKDIKGKMDKALAALGNELSKLRTGRAHPSLVEHILVDYYGGKTPLNQVASISIADSRTLLVSPWDKSAISAIEKGILAADLGLNPVSLGDTIRLPMPPLTEERRKDLIKVVKNEAELARVSVRNVRRDANTKVKESLKQKDITEDQERQYSEKIQKITDQYIADVEKLVKEKESELMEI